MTSIVSSGDSHVTFARALACPDKEVRDKTVVSLINYVAGLRNITEMEMLKLWKALYYCMWLSDKALIQMELAQALTGLFNSFNERDFAVLYFGIFFRTMVREWTLLDQHRINKFYTLIRLMLREGLSSMHKNGWTAESMDSLLDALEEEVLVRTPNGIRLHIADIFLEELMIVTKGDINTDAFVRALRPFFGAVQGCLDTSFQERVSNKIFSAFVKTFAREHKGSTEDEMLFLKVKTTVIQGMIFSIASDSDTADKNRRKLYLLHQEFPEVTGQPFVSFEEEEDEEEEIVMSIHNGSEARSSSGKSDVVAIKTKETQKQEAGEDLPLKKSKKRKADSEVPEPQQIQRKKEVNLKTPIISLEAVPAATKIEHKKIVVDAVPTVVKSKPTQKTDAPLPVANMIAVPSAATKATAVEATAPFIKSQRFTGGMLGYIFKKGKSGLGYYIDAAEMKKHAKQILKNAKISTEVKASIPIATTIIAMSDGKSKKKAKKDLEERRQSGDFPPAASVRVDDLASLEADDESKADRKVRFGKPQSKGYTDSIAGLKSGSSPHASLTPSHSALKHQESSSKVSRSSSENKGASPSSTSMSSLKKSKAKKDNTGGKSSSNFLAGRAN